MLCCSQFPHQSTETTSEKREATHTHQICHIHMAFTSRYLNCVKVIRVGIQTLTKTIETVSIFLDLGTKTAVTVIHSFILWLRCILLCHIYTWKEWTGLRECELSTTESHINCSLCLPLWLEVIRPRGNLNTHSKSIEKLHCTTWSASSQPQLLNFCSPWCKGGAFGCILTGACLQCVHIEGIDNSAVAQNRGLVFI